MSTDWEKKLSLWNAVRRGEKPLVESYTNWEFVQYMLLAQGHFLYEPANSFFSFDGESIQKILEKGDVSEDTISHTFYQQIHRFRDKYKNKGLKNYIPLGRWDHLFYDEADSFVLFPSSPQGIDQLFEILRLKTDGKWSKDKKIVIVNSPPEYGDNKTIGIYDPIIKEFDLSNIDGIDIVSNHDSLFDCLMEDLGDKANKIPDYPADKVIAEPEDDFVENTGNIKKPFEMEKILEELNFTGNIWLWNNKVEVSKEAKELAKTTVGNNAEKVEAALISQFEAGMAWLKEKSPENFNSLHKKIIKDININGRYKDGLLDLVEALKDDGSFGMVMDYTKEYFTEIGMDFDHVKLLVDDRGLEIFVADKAGKIDMDLSLAIFAESDVFKKLRDEGVINTSKPCPGAELANVMKKCGGLKEFYNMVWAAWREIAEKKNISIDDYNIITDDTQALSLVPLKQDDYAHLVKVNTHATRRNHLYENIIELKNGVFVSECVQGPLDGDGVRHIDDDGYFIKGSPTARAARTMAQLTAMYKNIKKLNLRLTRSFDASDEKKKFKVGFADAEQADKYKDILPDNCIAVHLFDEEKYGLENALVNGDAIISGVLQDFMSDCDAFVWLDQKTPWYPEKDWKYHVRRALFKQLTVGREIGDPLIYGKKTIVVRDGINTPGLNHLNELEHVNGCNFGLAGCEPEHLQTWLPNDSDLKNVLEQSFKRYCRSAVTDRKQKITSPRHIVPDYDQFCMTVYTSAKCEYEELKIQARGIGKFAAMLLMPLQTGGGGDGGMLDTNEGHCDGIDRIRELGIYSEEQIAKYAQLRLIQCWGTHKSEGTFERKCGNDKYNIYSVICENIRTREEALGVTKSYLANRGIDDFANRGGNMEVLLFGGNGTLEEGDLSISQRSGIKDKSDYKNSPIVTVNETINGSGGYFDIRRDNILDADVLQEVNGYVADKWHETLVIAIRSRIEAGQEPPCVNYPAIYEALRDEEFSGLSLDVAEQVISDIKVIVEPDVNRHPTLIK